MSVLITIRNFGAVISSFFAGICLRLFEMLGTTLAAILAVKIVWIVWKLILQFLPIPSPPPPLQKTSPRDTELWSPPKARRLPPLRPDPGLRRWNTAKVFQTSQTTPQAWGYKDTLCPGERVSSPSSSSQHLFKAISSHLNENNFERSDSIELSKFGQQHGRSIWYRRLQRQ